MRARTSALGAWLLPSVVRSATYLPPCRRSPMWRAAAEVTLSLTLYLNAHHTPQTMSKGTPACAMW
eukprot:2337888-Prymnesium_polylepis.1